MRAQSALRSHLEILERADGDTFASGLVYGLLSGKFLRAAESVEGLRCAAPGHELGSDLVTPSLWRASEGQISMALPPALRCATPTRTTRRVAPRCHDRTWQVSERYDNRPWLRLEFVH